MMNKLSWEHRMVSHLAHFPARSLCHRATWQERHWQLTPKRWELQLPKQILQNLRMPRRLEQVNSASSKIFQPGKFHNFRILIFIVCYLTVIAMFHPIKLALLISFDLVWSLLISSDLFWSILISFDLFGSLLISFDLFWSLLFSFMSFYSLLLSFILFVHFVCLGTNKKRNCDWQSNLRIYKCLAILGQIQTFCTNLIFFRGHGLGLGLRAFDTLTIANVVIVFGCFWDMLLWIWAVFHVLYFAAKPISSEHISWTVAPLGHLEAV